MQTQESNTPLNHTILKAVTSVHGSENCRGTRVFGQDLRKHRNKKNIYTTQDAYEETDLTSSRGILNLATYFSTYSFDVSNPPNFNETPLLKKKLIKTHKHKHLTNQIVHVSLIRKHIYADM